MSDHNLAFVPLATGYFQSPELFGMAEEQQDIGPFWASEALSSFYYGICSSNRSDNPHQ